MNVHALGAEVSALTFSVRLTFSVVSAQGLPSSSVSYLSHAGVFRKTPGKGCIDATAAHPPHSKCVSTKKTARLLLPSVFFFYAQRDGKISITTLLR